MYFMLLSESRLLGADQHGRTRRRGEASDRNSRTGNSSHIHGSPDRRKVSFTHQRSYSCGDLSPTDTVKEWGDENDEDESGSSRAAEELISRGFLLDRAGHRRGPEVPDQLRAKKDPTDRRQGWVRQKQKSKSFDFCWRSGMWSPVDEKNKVLIIVPTPRIGACKARLKLPSMFQMDSGSSYDSYEAAEIAQAAAQQHQRPPALPLPLQLPIQQQQHQRATVVPSVDSRLRREPSVSPASERERQRRPSPNRSWLLQERKSHSLDSSFDDRGYPQHDDRGSAGCAPAGAAYPGLVGRPPDAGPGGWRATVRDKRLRLLHRRKSRSLDMYEPGGGETNERRHRFRDRGSRSPFRISPIRGGGSPYPNDPCPGQRIGVGDNTSHRVDVFPRSPQHGGEAFARRTGEEGWTAAEGSEERRPPRRRPSEFLSERTAERVNIVVREYKTPSPMDHHKTPSPRDVRSSPIESGTREAAGWKDPRMSLFRDAYAAKEKAVMGHSSGTGSAASWDRRGLSPGGRRDPVDSSPVVDRERRTTFAEQKSFSYDVPSLQVRPEVQHRKQSEPIVGSSGLTPRSRGRLLPRLPIDESELGKHISQIFRFNQSVDVLQLRPFCSTLAAATTGGTKPPGAPSVVPHPPLPVKAPVEIEVTIDEADDRPPGSSSDDTDRRRSFTEQKSFSYEVNEYFQYEAAATVEGARSGETTASGGRRMRDYMDANELRLFHVDSEDLKDDGLPYNGDVPRTRRCRAMSQGLVLGGRRKGFADQKSFSYELASHPKHHACLVASARQRVLAVQSCAARNTAALHRQQSTEKERISLSHLEKVMATEKGHAQQQAPPTSSRDQQMESGRRRKSVYDEGRRGSAAQRPTKLPDAERSSGDERKAAAKTGRPILEKSLTMNRHLECPTRGEPRRLSLAAYITGNANQRNSSATVAAHPMKMETTKRTDDERRPVADHRIPAGNSTRDHIHRRSSEVVEVRKKSQPAAEQKKPDNNEHGSSEGDGGTTVVAAAKSQKPRQQVVRANTTATDSPPMNTLQIPTNTSRRAQHRQKHHHQGTSSNTTTEVRGRVPRTSTPPPGGDQRLDKSKDEAAHQSYFLSHKQQYALEQSSRPAADQKKFPDGTGESHRASCEVIGTKERERLSSAPFEKERPVFSQLQMEKVRPLPQDIESARDGKVTAEDVSAKTTSPLKGRLGHHPPEAQLSLQSQSPKTGHLLQPSASKYRDVSPLGSSPCRASQTPVPSGGTVYLSYVGADGELVSDGVVTWRRKSPDVGEMLASRKSGGSARHPARPKTDCCEADRRDAFAHQKSFSYDVATGRRSTDQGAGVGHRGERMVQSSGPVPSSFYGTGGSAWSRQFKGGGVCSARDRRISMMDSKKSYSLDEYMSLQKQLLAMDQTPRPSRQVQRTERPSAVVDHLATPCWSPSRDAVADSTDDPSGLGETDTRSPATTPQRKMMLLHSMKALQDSEELARAQDGDGSEDSPSDDARRKSAAPGDVPERDVEQRARKTSRLPIARFFGKLKMDRRSDRDATEQRP